MPLHIFHSDRFTVPLPPGHRFPMEKYARLRRRVERWTSNKGGSTVDVRLQTPDGATDQELAMVHDPRYVEKMSSGTLEPLEIRRIGFPWSQGLVERSRRSVGGTVAAARAALAHGVAVNLSGGTHHAFPDRGEGFCVFNDVAVAARMLLREAGARRILVMDLDVHQGNGTAFIFRESPEVFTLSVHGANNYPFRKQPGDLDLGLPDGAGDGPYLDAVARGLLLAQAEPAFDLGFFVAGADPFAGDRLGRLAVSKEGLRERDRMVFSTCREIGIPLAVVMGGGYASLTADTVDIHFQTVLSAANALGIPGDPS